MTKRAIPNALTCAALLSGMYGIVAVFEGGFLTAFCCIILASFFDILDGTAARLLRVDNDAGKLLDSFADMISFGVLPSLFLYEYMATFTPSPPHAQLMAYGALLIVPCVALRLVGFIQQPPFTRYRGLPSPAAALFLTSCSFSSRISLLWLTIISFVICVMMLSNIPMIQLKYRSYGWKQNIYRYVFSGGFLILAIWIQEYIFLIFVPIYFLISCYLHFVPRGSLSKSDT